MIQRIQTVYLLLALLLSVLFMTGKILTFNDPAGRKAELTFSVQKISTAGNSSAGTTGIIPFTVFSVLVPVVALVAIFLYKKRKVQMRAAILAVILELFLMGAGIYYSLVLFRDFPGKIVPGFRAIIPLVSVLLILLAIRGIKKDEYLVKSYDRLR